MEGGWGILWGREDCIQSLRDCTAILKYYNNVYTVFWYGNQKMCKAKNESHDFREKDRNDTSVKEGMM
jgi:hypothetical protein